MPKRRHASVALPDNVFCVKKPSGKKYYYYQERRGRLDHGPLIRLPDDLHDPLFWQRHNEIRTGQSGPAAGTFAALIALYRTSAKFGKLSASSKVLYEKMFARISDAWGPQPVRDLLPKHIYALQETMADTPSMANMVVTVLRVVLAHGIKFDYSQINVAREIEPLEEAGVGAEPWPEAAFAYVLANAPPLLMRAAVLGRATGQRGVDLVKLRPSDRAGRGFKMMLQKLGNERHWQAVTVEGLQTIDSWGEEPMRPFLNVDGRKISGGRLRAEWAAFRTLHVDRIPADATLHDLRAMAVCDLRIGGVAHQQISDLICMSVDMVMRYSKYIDREQNARAGMRTMERPENDVLKTIYAAAENRKS